MFSKTLDKDHIANAIEMRKGLVDTKPDIDDIVINTKELYEQAFTFPNVAQYEHV